MANNKKIIYGNKEKGAEAASQKEQKRHPTLNTP